MKTLSWFSCLLLLAPAVAAGPEWKAITAWEGSSPVVRVQVGHPDPADRNLQAVGVEEDGGVVVAHFAQGRLASASRVFRHPGRLTGLAVAHVDPSAAGEEIYAGGYASGTTGGAVIQLVLASGVAKARTVFSGDAFVHAVERIGPAKTGGPARLLVTTYAGEVYVLTPKPGSGEWDRRLVHREPAATDKEQLHIKDVAVLARTEKEPQEVFVAARGGRGVVLDPDRDGSARLVLDEPGGLSRAVADGTGGVFVVGYKGRVVHLVRNGDAFEQHVLYVEPDAGWRGVARGKFPVAGSDATLAVYGYGKRCRALTEKAGQWVPVTLFDDTERGHSLVAADLVPGNGADELVLGSYSNRMLVLTLAAPAN